MNKRRSFLMLFSIVFALSANASSPFFDEEFQFRIDLLTESELTTGNKVRMIEEKDHPSVILEVVNRAEKFLFVALPDLECKGEWEPVLSAMKERAAKGVDVRLMIEASSLSQASNHCVSGAADGGVKVERVKKGRSVLSLFVRFGLHFWLRDGVESVISGNPTLWVSEGPLSTDILDAYVTAWKSIDARNKLPSIQEYQTTLDRQRDAEFRRDQRGQIKYGRWLQSPAMRMNGTCRFVVQPFGAKKKALAHVFGAYFMSAERKVVWSSPQYKKALIAPRYVLDAMRNGETEFEFLTNSRAGFKDRRFLFHKLAYRKTLKGLQEVGVNTGGRASAWGTKKWTNVRGGLIDDAVSVATTWAWDKASTKRDQVQAVICMDEGLSRQLADRFARTKENAEQIR